MKLAYRYIFRELLWPMLFGVAAFVSILVAGNPLQSIMKLAFQGVAPALLLRLFLLLLPPLVVLTLPMSMLLSTLLGFGRMSGDSETVAMYAGGVSLYRLAVPVILLALVMMAVTISINENVTPWSIDASERLKDEIAGQVKEQKHFELKLDQYSGKDVVGYVQADSYTPKTGIMTNVKAFEFKHGSPTRVVFAKHAVHRVDDPVGDKNWVLQDGWYQDVGPDAKGSPLVQFKQWFLTIQQPPSEIQAEGKKASDMSMAQLSRKIHSLNREGRSNETPEYEVAWWNRLAMPFACVVFALVGLPLGLRPQRTSSGLGLGMSIVIIFLYWVVWYYTGNLGARGVLPPFVASWLANFAGIGIGTALLVRAPK